MSRPSNLQCDDCPLAELALKMSYLEHDLAEQVVDLTRELKPDSDDE